MIYKETMKMNLKPIVVAAIATITFGVGFALPALSQARSSCTARLTARERDTRINVRSRPGTRFPNRHYGRVGDTVTIIRGNVNGLAIRKDARGADWVQVEFSQSKKRGWIRRDFVGAFRC